MLIKHTLNDNKLVADTLGKFTLHNLTNKEKKNYTVVCNVTSIAEANPRIRDRAFDDVKFSK